MSSGVGPSVVRNKLKKYAAYIDGERGRERKGARLI